MEPDQKDEIKWIQQAAYFNIRLFDKTGRRNKTDRGFFFWKYPQVVQASIGGTETAGLGILSYPAPAFIKRSNKQEGQQHIQTDFESGPLSRRKQKSKKY